jgi:hypothetical protein
MRPVLSRTRAVLGLLTSLLLVFGLVIGGVAATSTSAFASGTYDNATIATDALADVGQNPAPGGGQCKAFANAMVIAASGGTQSPSGYQSGWAAAGGTSVSSANAAKGDIIQITPAGSTDSNAESIYAAHLNDKGGNAAYKLHTTIVVANNGNDSFTVVDANFTATNTVGEHYTFDPYTWAAGSIVDIWRMGTVSASGGNVVHSTTILKVKKVIASDGTQQVYYATPSDVYEAWWNSTSNGVQRDDLINLSQNDIVDMDKITQPDGTQSVYTAEPNKIWETYWNSSTSPQSTPIVTTLSGISRIIATSEIDSGTYTHVLYVLTSSGPYQVWWQDGGNGIHIAQLAQLSNPVAFSFDQTSGGTDQLYTATAGAVYETWWNPGGSVTTDEIIGISQNDITGVSKVIASNGTQELYTSTTVGVWQSEWGGSVGGLTNTYMVNNFSGSVGVLKMFDPSGNDNMYVANGGAIQQYWWNSSASGGSTLITISQGNIKSFDVDYDNGVGQLYTAAGSWIYETYWDGSGIHTNPLANANP